MRARAEVSRCALARATDFSSLVCKAESSKNAAAISPRVIRRIRDFNLDSGSPKTTAGRNRPRDFIIAQVLDTRPGATPAIEMFKILRNDIQFRIQRRGDTLSRSSTGDRRS